MLIFTAALHTVGKTRKSPTCPLTDKRRNKRYTGLFSTVKRNAALTHGTLRINLGNHMLKEVRRERTSITWVHWRKTPRMCAVHWDKKQHGLVLSQGLGKENEVCSLELQSFCLGGWKTFGNRQWWRVDNTERCCSVPRSLTLKMAITANFICISSL